jgi:hypothetical protein
MVGESGYRIEYILLERNEERSAFKASSGSSGLADLLMYVTRDCNTV